MMLEDEDPISLAFKAGSERKDRLHKVIANLEIQRVAIENCSLEWKEIMDYFTELESSLQKRFQHLIAKEKALESKSQQLRQVLDKREEAVSAREQAMLSRVQEQKDSAISSLLEEKRKWLEERRTRHAGTGQAAAEKSPHVAAAVPKSVVGVTTTTPDEPVNSAPVAPNDPALPSQAMEVDAAAAASKLAGIPTVTASSEGALALAAAAHVSVIANKQSQEMATKSSQGQTRIRIQELWQTDGLVFFFLSASMWCWQTLFWELITQWCCPMSRNLPHSWHFSMGEIHLGLLPMCKLVTAFARHMANPCVLLLPWTPTKIPDVVDRLAKEGKQIEALSFAHAFGIMNRIQPVLLLKNYLKEARKTAQSILKNGNSSMAAQNDAALKELAALKAVLNCIEEYHLETHYPSMPLQKRVVQLEKAKSDRKRAAVAVKAGHTKRPRTSNATHGCGGYGGGSGSNNNSNNYDNRSYYQPSDRSQPSQYGRGVGVSSYSFSPQNSNYDRSGHQQGAYSTTYVSGNRTPVSLSSSQVYSAEHGYSSQAYGPTTGYNNPSAATYSSYQFGSSLQRPTPPTYQASFLH
ncbi:unnamed protein product [Sphagnum jensenii]|uniref:FRIGIDA-like protein n=1 Tax=Sphagnum jensenii TaxID=128206 RepID=A0ABP1B588_9BRYO